jgi:hypothetical protein
MNMNIVGKCLRIIKTESYSNRLQARKREYLVGRTKQLEMRNARYEESM